MMDAFIQALIMAFREGLEAFLIIAILIKYLDKTQNKNLKKHVWHGMFWGIIASLLIGLALFLLTLFIGSVDSTAKIWESLASIIAVILITTFIVWMIKHGSQMRKHIEGKAALNLTTKGIFLISMFMVLREGAEIAVFSFAGKYHFIPVILGLLLSVILVILIFYSIVNIKIKTIFKITLIYLILQAGFLLGYGIHEGLSASKGLINPESLIYNKAFDLSGTIMNHKSGSLGIPLYVSLGWYSKPEWVQFIVQYTYTFLLLGFWYLHKKKHFK